jgi:hypothetical protein
MPGPLRYLKSDPNHKKRGAGWYYHRGRGVYSRKDDALDRGYKATRYGQKLRGSPPKIGSGVYRHTHDITTKKARISGRVRPRTPGAPKGRIPGFMRGAPKKKKAKTNPPRRRTCAVRGCSVRPIRNRKYCSKHRN